MFWILRTGGGGIYGDWKNTHAFAGGETAVWDQCWSGHRRSLDASHIGPSGHLHVDHGGVGFRVLHIPAEYLLADRGYDTNGIVAEAEGQGMEPVIPPRSHRKEQRYYDRALYKLRHLVENSFLDFKQWRGVATRYAKNAASFLAICQIRALVIWTKLF